MKKNLRNGTAPYKNIYEPSDYNLIQNKRNKFLSSVKFLSLFMLMVIPNVSCTNKPKPGTVADRQAFRGIVSSDEPQATLIGRDILSIGGSAADAAIAMSFALTVTLPSRAGIDGGGFCQFYSPSENKAETLDFMPKPINRTDKGNAFISDEEVIVPSLPRGLFALYARGGNLRWQELVFPAENLAKFGMSVSRSFANDLEKLKSEPSENPEVSRIFKRFSTNDGSLLREGNIIYQIDIANVLSGLRTKGVGDLYSGVIASRYLDFAKASSPNLNADYLKNYRPQWLPSEKIPFNNNVVYFPNTETIGNSGAKIWQGLVSGDKSSGQAAEAELHKPRPSQTSFAATNLVAVDNTGMGVSCVLTMGELFGKKRILGEIGMIKTSSAEAFRSQDFEKNVMGSMIIANENVKDLRYAAAVSGIGSVAELIDATAFATYGEKSLSEALTIVANNSKDSDRRINIINCKSGLPAYPDSCSAITDIRGSGLFRFSGVPKKGRQPSGYPRLK